MSFSYELQNEWQSCREASDFVQLPDGNYTATIHSIKIETSTSKSGEVYSFLIYNMGVVEGEYENANFQKRDFINQKALPFIKRDMLKLGVNIPQYARDMALALQPAIGLNVLLKVRTSQGSTRDFVNIDFLRVIEPMPSAPLQAAPAPAAPAQAAPRPPAQGNPRPPITYPSAPQGNGRAQHELPAEYPDHYPYDGVPY